MISKKSLFDVLFVVAAAVSLLALSSPGFAACPIPVEEFTPDPKFTSSFLLENCTFTSEGANPYFILQPGYRIVLESAEEKVRITVLNKTKVVDGVTTRVVEEREWEKNGNDLVLKEVSRNFFAICEQTNSVFYFGEDVAIYDENGAIVSHEGKWRAGVHGAKPGLIMPGTILLGSRYYQEIAPADSAVDKGQIVAMQDQCKIGESHFESCVTIQDTTDCNPDAKDRKIYAKGVGLVQDEDMKIVYSRFVNQDQ
jgi:hypothetical protein